MIKFINKYGEIVKKIVTTYHPEEGEHSVSEGRETPEGHTEALQHAAQMIGEG